jgi:hypothetical protein
VTRFKCRCGVGIEVGCVVATRGKRRSEIHLDEALTSVARSLGWTFRGKVARCANCSATATPRNVVLQ